MSRRSQRNEAKRMRTDEDRLRVEAAISEAVAEDHARGSHGPARNTGCPACNPLSHAGFEESSADRIQDMDNIGRFG